MKSKPMNLQSLLKAFSLILVAIFSVSLSSTSSAWAWKKITSHICNYADVPLEFNVTSSYQIKGFDPSEFILTPGECTGFSYETKWHNNNWDADNAADISVSKVENGVASPIGSLHMQGKYVVSDSCVSVTDHFNGEWSIERLNNGHDSLTSCWRLSLPDYGFRLAVAPPPAAGLFDASNQPLAGLILKPGYQNHALIKNLSGHAQIFDISLVIPEGLNTFFEGSTCSTQTSIPAGGSCTIAYTVPEHQPPVGSYSLVLQSGTTRDPILEIPVLFTVDKGHLQIDTDTQKAVMEVNVAAGETLKLYLQNKGVGIASSLTYEIDDEVSSYLSNNCGSALSPGQSCIMTISLPSSYANQSNSEILVRGTNLDTNPVLLRVNTFSGGSLVVQRPGSSASLESVSARNGESGKLVIRNVGDREITSLTIQADVQIRQYLTGNCLSNTPTLSAGSSCGLDYDLPAGSVANSVPAGLYNITLSATGAVNSPKTLGFNVTDKGYFSVEKDATSIQDLNLVPNDKGTVQVINKGGSDITGFSVVIPSGIAGFFTNGCSTLTTLARNASCSLGYTIPASPTAKGPFTLTLLGSNVDNNRHKLYLDIASQGHLVFIQNHKIVPVIEAFPGDEGKIKIRNQGGSQVTGFSVDIPLSIKDYFSGACLTRTEIGKDSSCNMKYKIPETEFAAGAFRIGLNGSNLDNSTNELQLKIYASESGYLTSSTHGRLAYNTIYTEKNDSGIIDIRNTGAAGITNFKISSLAAPPSLLSGSCLSAATVALGPHQACSISYNIPADAHANAFYQVKVDGMNTENAPIYLNLLVTTLPYINFKNQSISRNGLYAPPGSSGSIQIENDGNLDITNFKVSIPAAITSYFADRSSTCPTTTTGTLRGGGNCTLNYAFPTTPLTQTYELVATGTNAKNSGVALQIVNKQPLIFVAHQNMGKIESCSASYAGSAVQNCVDNNHLFNTRTSKLIVSPAGNKAYFANRTTNFVSVCTIDQNTGAFSACQRYGVSTFGVTELGSIALSSDGNHLIVGEQSSDADQAAVCALTSSGLVGQCTKSGSLLADIHDIEMTPSGSHIVASRSTNVITTCSYNSQSTTLGSCENQTIPGNDDINSIDISPDGTKMLYSTLDYYIGECGLNGSAVASGCATSEPLHLFDGEDIRQVIYSASGGGVIAVGSNNDLFFCQLGPFRLGVNNCSSRRFQPATASSDSVNLYFNQAAKEFFDRHVEN